MKYKEKFRILKATNKQKKKLKTIKRGEVNTEYLIDTVNLYYTIGNNIDLNKKCYIN